MQRAAILSMALASGLALAPDGARAQPILPDFESAEFTPGAPIDNPYFPLLDRQTRVYVSRENGEANRFELTVVGPGPTILDVETTNRRDRAFEDDRLVEDTFDYFAQDAAGNVWYFGEDVTNYLYDAQGNLIGTDSASSWRAGENLANPLGDPAQPGFIMSAEPSIGFEYFQEFAEDDGALDQAEEFAFVPQLSVAIGDFSDVLQLLETTQVEPDAREFKYYAPDAGLVLAEEGLDPDLEDPEETFELVRVVPEASPPAGLGLAVLALLGAGRRARSRGSRPPDA